MIATEEMFDLRQVAHDDPTIQMWLRKLAEQNEHLVWLARKPASWLGLYKGDRLMVAVGYSYIEVYSADLFINTEPYFYIDYLLCEPTKAGRVALYAALKLLLKVIPGKTIRFNTQINNRKINKILLSLGAKPVAAIREMQGG